MTTTTEAARRTFTRGSWECTVSVSLSRPSRYRYIARRGEGRAAQVINLELLPQTVEAFDPDDYWRRR
jgi:hypothetical protein